MITITITGRGRIRPRTRDKAMSLAELYADLADRLHRALLEVQGKTQDDYDPAKHPHAPAGQSNGGQFVSTPGGPSGEKPTKTVAKIAKHAIHELLSSGHPFSVSELKTITGHDNEKTLQSWITMFKSPKYAGPKGALNIKKLPNGSYQVVMPDGTQAPKNPDPMPNLIDDLQQAKEEVVVPPPPEPAATLTKAQADKSYADSMAKASKKMGVSITGSQVNGDLDHAYKQVLKFKEEKAAAMAQWAKDYHGHDKKPAPQQLFESDKILAKEIFDASDTVKVNEYPEAIEKAIANWKKNTQLEKQGKLGAEPAPKPDTKTLADAVQSWAHDLQHETPPKPKAYEHLVPKGFEHISAKDFDTPGKPAFMAGIADLKAEMEGKGTNAIANKKLVEKTLTDRLKDKPHFQALSKQVTKSGSSMSLEARLVSSWAGSSGDGNPLSCALQVATHEAMSLPDHAVTYTQLHSVNHLGKDDALMKEAGKKLGIELKHPLEIKAFRAGLHEFIHAQYENTQDYFKSLGKDHVYLARGMKIDVDAKEMTHEPADIKLQPASSFSTNYATAKGFAGGKTVFLAKVPVSQILGSYLTGFGCSNEHEVVVLGHETIKSYPVKVGEGSTLTDAMKVIKARIKK